MMPAITAAKPTWRPADRSVPLVIRQPDTPKAIRNRMAVLLSRFVRFPQEKKLSTMHPTTIAAISSRKTMGFRVMILISFFPKLL